MAGSSTEIESRPSFEVIESATELAELESNQGVLDENNEIISFYGEYANGLNKKLSDLGIRPDSPEILASIPFVNTYNSTIDGNLSTTENYDFMIFQTQFDLTIKEIINKKIRNDLELQDLVLTEYRDTYAAYKVKKDALQSLYLTSINVTSMINIKENTVSQIKNNSSFDVSTAKDPNSEKGIRDAAIEIAGQEAKKLGVSLSNMSLVEFLHLFAPGVPNNFSTGDGNLYFRNLCQYLVNSFFSLPYRAFSKNIASDLANDQFLNPSSGLYGDIYRDLESIQFAQVASIASRGLVYRTSSDFLELISDLNNSSTTEGFSYSTLEDMARRKIGVKSDPSFNTGARLIEKTSFSTPRGVYVEVFNDTVQEQSLTNSEEIITGKQYFSRDVKDYLTSGNTLDLSEYVNNLSGYSSKIAAGLSSEITSNGFKISNGIIQEFGKILFDTLNFEKFTTDHSATDLDMYVALSTMMMFKNTDFNKNYSSADFDSTPGDDFEVRQYKTQSIQASGDEISINIGSNISDNFSSEAASITIALNYTDPFHAFDVFLSDSQFESFRDTKMYFHSTPTSRTLVNSELSLKIEELFRKVLILANDQSYVDNLYILDMFFNFCHELFKSFMFYIRGDSLLSDEDCLIDQDSIDVIAAVRDLASGNIFTDNSLEKILGHKPSESEENLLIQRIKNLYKNLSMETIAAYNVALSLKKYTDEFKNKVSSLGNTIEQIESANIENTATPSIESLTCLNVAAEKIYLPTSCFSPDPTFFTYLGSRNSKDMGVINSVLMQNPNNINKTESEETKVLAIGIPDGLIDKLRSNAGLSNNHTIIEISFYEIDHRKERSSTEFHKAFSYYFNTCLHINTVSTDQNVSDIELITDLESFNKTVYIDNTGTFEDFDFDTEKILTFNFGKILNQDFSLQKFETFDEAIQFNKTYKINSSEFIFNDTFSNEIIRSHLINYGLRKKFEIFSGISFDEFNFPMSYFPSLDLTNQNLINQTASQSAINLINHFQNQDYTDDLKDYLARTSLQSAVINPSYFLNKSLSVSKFERIFLIPAYKSNLDLLTNDQSNFEFKTLIPVVSIIWQQVQE